MRIWNRKGFFFSPGRFWVWLIRAFALLVTVVLLTLIFCLKCYRCEHQPWTAGSWKRDQRSRWRRAKAHSLQRFQTDPPFTRYVGHTVMQAICICIMSATEFCDHYIYRSSRYLGRVASFSPTGQGSSQKCCTVWIRESAVLPSAWVQLVRLKAWILVFFINQLPWISCFFYLKKKKS